MPARPGGFTLLEMLVTLVIVALAAGLVSELLAQVRRVEQRLSESGLQGQSLMVHREWVTATLDSMLPGDENSPERFRGEPLSVQGLCTSLPVADVAGIPAVRVDLRRQGDGWSLFLQNAPTIAALTEGGGVELLHWQGGEARMRYLDAKGEWQDRWPPGMAQAAALPRAIVVIADDERPPVLVATPKVSDQPLARRLTPEQLP